MGILFNLQITFEWTVYCYIVEFRLNNGVWEGHSNNEMNKVFYIDTVGVLDEDALKLLQRFVRAGVI